MDVDNSVEIKVIFFAYAKEVAGCKQSTLRLPKSLSYSQLLNTLVDTYSLAAIKNNILISINEEIFESNTFINLNCGDEIAIIPPLSGG